MNILKNSILGVGMLILLPIAIFVVVTFGPIARLVRR